MVDRGVVLDSLLWATQKQYSQIVVTVSFRQSHLVDPFTYPTPKNVRRITRLHDFCQLILRTVIMITIKLLVL